MFRGGVAIFPLMAKEVGGQQALSSVGEQGEEDWDEGAGQKEWHEKCDFYQFCTFERMSFGPS